MEKLTEEELNIRREKEAKQHLREKKQRIKMKMKSGSLTKEEGQTQLDELEEKYPTKKRKKLADARGYTVGKRVKNGGYMVSKVGWGRDEEGKLTIPEGKKIPCTRGWQRGLSEAEKMEIEQHNRNIDIDEQREVFEKQDKKAAKFTPAQRVSAAAHEVSKQLVNEVEAKALQPIHFGDAASIKNRRDFIFAMQDTIKYHKSLLEHRDLIAEEKGEAVDSSCDGVSDIADIRKKMNELKKVNDKEK